MCRMKVLERRKNRSTKPRLHSTARHGENKSASLKSRRPLRFERQIQNLLLRAFFLKPLKQNGATRFAGLLRPLNFQAFEVTAEARCVHAMLAEELRSDEDYWHVVAVAREQDWVVINVHFLQAGACRG